MTNTKNKASNDPFYGLLSLPWTITTGVKDDGTRWAQCAEIPHAIVYADADEDIDVMFWDSLRASLEALAAIGEPIPLPEGARWRTPLGNRVIAVQGMVTVDGSTDNGRDESVAVSPAMAVPALVAA